MRYLKSITLTLVAIIIVTSCKRQININDYFDSSRSVELIVDNKSESVEMNYSNKIILTSEDERIKKLISWGNENLDKWKHTPASYAMASVHLMQEDFHLRYWKSGFVVIEFKDKEGKQRQMTKKLDTGELGFLYN